VVVVRGDPASATVLARARRRRARGRGQGLVEFAISLPVVLLMILFGIDFGRVFLGWVTLGNAVREAANFAALNPTAWTAPGNPAAVAEYDRLISAYIQGSNEAVCNTSNGATSCLVGRFVDILSSGTVGPGNGSGTGNKALGVQLIR